MNFFDLHTDTPTRLQAGINPAKTAGFDSSFFQQYIAVRAIWLDDRLPAPRAYYEQTLHCLQKIEPPNHRIAANNPKHTLLMVENAGFLAEEPDYLKVLSRQGVRILSLSWNGPNKLAGGALSSGALTPLGEKIMIKAEQLGITVDLSHLNEKSALAASLLLQRPIATHSCCAAVCAHPRNLSDRVLQQIGRKGGLIGLCLYPPFLGGDPFQMLPRHIRHLQRLGLEKNIAIGTDFDGAEMPPTLQSNRDIPTLYRHLQQNGLKKELLDLIFYQNALAFFQKMCHNEKE